MLLLAVLTVLVVGPKDLPKVMRGIGNFIRKIRGMAGDFMDGVDDLARENDLEEVTRQIKNVKTGNVAGFIGDAIDPDGELADTAAEVKKTAAEASKISLDQIRADKKKATERKAELASKNEAAKEVKKKAAKKPAKKSIKKVTKKAPKTTSKTKTSKKGKAKS